MSQRALFQDSVCKQTKVGAEWSWLWGRGCFGGCLTEDITDGGSAQGVEGISTETRAAHPVFSAHTSIILNCCGFICI